MATPNQPYGSAPHVGTHPEIVRFEREFDRRLIPPDVQLSFEPNAISGERPNTGLSRLGFTFGLLFAMLIGGGIVVWLPP